MGLIKAAVSAVSGTLADQWKDAISCPSMDNTVILRKGTRMNTGKGSNTKGNPDIISNGSVILVEENTCMMTIDGGKITNIVAEPGSYTFDSSSAPSIFAGQIAETVQEALNRFMFGGSAAMQQKVVFVNLMPLPGIPFGTGTPVPYPDPRYNTTIDLRFYGTFEIQILNAEMAVRFYNQVASKGASAGDIPVGDIFKSQQYKNEFMQSMMKALNLLSAQGVSYNQFSSYLDDLTGHVQTVTQDNWLQRGFKVTAVGMGPVTISDESKELLKDRLKADTMLGGDVQRAMMAGSVARGIEAAAGNTGGSMVGFMGMNMAMNSGGNVMGQMGEVPQPQQQQGVTALPGGGIQQPAPPSNSWKCDCGVDNTGKFCAECGKPKPEPVAASDWTCVCGAKNTGRFCGECGKQKPEEQSVWVCSCGRENIGKFCADCGKKKDDTAEG